MTIKEKIRELHESVHLSLEDFDEKYVSNEEDGNPEYERTQNIINNVNNEIFQLKNKVDMEHDEIKKRIKRLNKQIEKERKKNEFLSLEKSNYKNSHLGAEQLLKDKESIYFSNVLVTVHFLISVLGLSFMIYKKNNTILNGSRNDFY